MTWCFPPYIGEHFRRLDVLFEIPILIILLISSLSKVHTVQNESCIPIHISVDTYNAFLADFIPSSRSPPIYSLPLTWKNDFHQLLP
jgi:hypothetical protein